MPSFLTGRTKSSKSAPRPSTFKSNAAEPPGQNTTRKATPRQPSTRSGPPPNNWLCHSHRSTLRSAFTTTRIFAQSNSLSFHSKIYWNLKLAGNTDFPCSAAPKCVPASRACSAYKTIQPQAAQFATQQVRCAACYPVARGLPPSRRPGPPRCCPQQPSLWQSSSCAHAPLPLPAWRSHKNY